LGRGLRPVAGRSVLAGGGGGWLLRGSGENDRFPLSPRVRRLRAFLGKLAIATAGPEPQPPMTPPGERQHGANPQAPALDWRGRYGGPHTVNQAFPGGRGMSVFRPEFIEALALLAKACDDVAARGFDRPILVGGAAVEFHTGSAVVSGDFDFVAADQRAFEEALIACGFRREDRRGRLLRGFYHPELSLGVEVVSGSLFDGRCDMRRVQLVEIIDGKVVAIAPVEDMIADRMGQYISTVNRVPEMLDQAVKLFQLADTVDDTYLDRRIRDETAGELGLAFLRERAA
jgi:hypothetical protein